MTTLNVPLSKATEKLRAQIVELQERIAAIQPEINQLVSSDTGDLSKLSKRLAELRCESELSQAKLLRLQSQVAASLIPDIEGARVAAMEQRERILEELRTAKASWREMVLALHRRDAAKKILGDPTLKPLKIRECQRACECSTKSIADIEHLLRSVDAVFDASVTGAAAPMSGRRQTPDYQHNALKFLGLD